MSEENKMTKGGNEITKEEWTAYRNVQDGGMYNMFDPDAVRETGLDKETYMTIIKNYSSLEEKYEKEDDKETD